MQEKYQPTEEDHKKARETMTEEQREASKSRESAYPKFDWEEFKNIRAKYYSAVRADLDARCDEQLYEERGAASRELSEYIESRCPLLESLDLTEAERESISAFVRGYAGGGIYFGNGEYNSVPTGVTGKDYVLAPDEFVEKLREWRKKLGVHDDEYVTLVRGSLWERSSTPDQLREDENARIVSPIHNEDLGLMARKLK